MAKKKLDEIHDDLFGQDTEQETQETTKKSKVKNKEEDLSDIDNIDMDKIIALQNKEYKSLTKKLESHVISQAETPPLHTGIPMKDIALGGGIPSKRMTYMWGPSGTGKTTMAFEIAYHNFLRFVYTKKIDDWKFIFLDSEEGESKPWLDRIGIRLPYRYDVPDSIEAIKGYLTDLKKEYSDKQILLIWDSVSATGTANPTGRADVARPVTDLFRNIKLTELEMTLLTINQHREKQDQYAAAVPPGGNQLRHKSHLTWVSPSFAKSEFWKNKKYGRSVLFRTQKARDSFNDVDYRLEMNYFSGFDSVMSLLAMAINSLKILKRKDAGAYAFEIGDEFQFAVEEEKKKTIYNVSKKELIDFDLEGEKHFENFKEIYNFFFDQASDKHWRFILRYFAYQLFYPYFMFEKEKFWEFFIALIQNVESYYFSNWNLFLKTVPTRLSV